MKLILGLFLAFLLILCFWGLSYNTPAVLDYFSLLKASLTQEPDFKAEDFDILDMGNALPQVKLAAFPISPPEGQTVKKENPQKSLQDQLDDIAEELDIMQAEVQKMIEEEQEKELEIEEIKEQEDEKEDNEEKTEYPKILISETRISPIDQRFIKLFNPNSFLVDLTGWYLQRKTQNSDLWQSLVTSLKFDGKTISPNSWIVISRSAPGDIVIDDLTLTSNNALALKNPDGEISDLAYTASENFDNPGGGGGVVYPKILISEIQAYPYGSRFLELYNPNGQDVELEGWYLQRKTKNSTYWASFVPSTGFSGKTIPAYGYFLVSRGEGGGSNDVFTNNPITENNSFALKNPKGEITDKLGYGLASDFEAQPALEFLAGQGLGRRFDEASQLYLDTDDNSADFEKTTPTPKEKNKKWEDDPDDPGGEISVQTSLKFVVNLDITDSFGQVVPSGLASFILRWKEEGGEWQEYQEEEISGCPASADIKKVFEGEDKKTYYFQVMAKDCSGNVSAWMPDPPPGARIELPETEPLSVVINEIQTAGQTAKDEFIELYNPNDFGIDLAGYALKKKTSGRTESNLVSVSAFIGTIPGLGFFLIAPQPQDDGTQNYTGQAVPNLFYSGKTYSVASDNTVLLYDSDGNLADRVGFGEAQDFEVVAATNPLAGQSISRSLGADTNDNSLDFIVLEIPTPGS